MRSLLCLLLAACSASSPTTPPLATPPPLTGKGADIELRPVSRHVWLHESWAQVPGFGRVSANGLVVVGSRGAVVVDSSWTNAQMAWLLDRVKQATGKQALGVVATHWHNDRAGGFAEANRRGVPTIAEARTDRILATKKLARPTHPFTSVHQLDLGGVKLEVFFPGAGHSTDNTVVYVADDRVLFGGCLIRAGTSNWIGNLSDADVSSWPATMLAVEKRYRDVSIVVPGHGRRGGAELIRHTHELATRASHK